MVTYFRVPTEKIYINLELSTFTNKILKNHVEIKYSVVPSFKMLGESFCGFLFRNYLRTKKLSFKKHLR